MDNTKNRELSTPSHRVSCDECATSRLCLPSVVEPSKLDEFDRLHNNVSILAPGTQFIHAGSPASALYMVRSGSVKSHFISAEGDEQILGFHFPGELVGWDGISEGKFENYATSLETTSICCIPIAELEALATKVPSLQHKLFCMMSRELLEEQELIMLLNKKNTDARVAAFIVNLSARFSERGLSPLRFRLPMSRSDIANFLGMASETVSRVFTRLSSKQVLTIQRNELSILDFDAINAIAGTKCRLVKKVAGL